MKKTLFTLSLSFCTLFSFSQITVTDSDIASVGDVIYQAVDTLPSSSIQPGNAGPNQSWDFSSLQVMELDQTEFISPVGTPYAFMYPSANLCAELDDGEYMYIEKTASGINILGFDAFQYGITILPLPLVYGGVTTYGPDLLMDSVLPNFFFPDSLAFMLTNFQAHKIDSINIKVTSETEFNVDAYGNVTIPMGTYDALRVESSATTTTEYYAYCTDTLFGTNSGWYSAALFAPNEVETEQGYQWWTNDPSIKFMLVQMSVDPYYGYVDAVDFMTSPSTNLLELDNNEFSVYPIPASYYINIVGEKGVHANLFLIDNRGKIVAQKDFNSETKLNLSNLSKGVYFIQIKTEDGVLTKKINVQ